MSVVMIKTRGDDFCVLELSIGSRRCLWVYFEVRGPAIGNES